MRILFVANKDITLFLFRKELIEELLKRGHKVSIACPYGSKLDLFKDLGCELINVDIDRRGKNPLRELKTIHIIRKAIKRTNPDFIFTYTIKPNLYVGLISRLQRIKYIPTITGLGTALYKDGLSSKLLKLFYKIGFKKASTIVFQNETNMAWFKSEINQKVNAILVNGSGVNLDKFQYDELKESNITTYLFLGRVMKDKGIDEFIAASRVMKSDFGDSVLFQIAGYYEENYENTINELQSKGIIKYLGYVDNTIELIKKSTVVVLPSYHEGLSNVLLEAQAVGRPVIASDIPGCKETFINGESGLSIKPKDKNDLISKMLVFHHLPFCQKIEMGKLGRTHVQEVFDRNKIVSTYINIIS